MKGENKLKSRKFWFGLVGAIVPIATQAATGEVGWPEAVGLSVTAALGYLLAQGYEDGQRQRRTLPDVTSAQLAALYREMASEEERRRLPVLPIDPAQERIVERYIQEQRRPPERAE